MSGAAYAQHATNELFQSGDRILVAAVRDRCIRPLMQGRM
jgi:hypothetical protein